ncbi:DUF6624 domain-containing protein [Arsenicibacter rosenii]|uniref:Uncharacterized protein n=1 Tax=Arsenicibacter rosenii TaxID=1750698 RepID=A0A1S2VJ55_9BACT|nr:DUF6624 domain-containing protein [Arsenicibacter rosenii]OIN58246.1 hypothetical protein BLX24_14660 [Arsenicibacter rosenii]
MPQTSIPQQIIALKDADLAMRDQLIRTGQLGEGYHPDMAQLHNHNAAVLDDIIDRIGFPTVDAVGKEASEAAWLVMQHAIGQPVFMKKCCALLEQAVLAQQANPIHLAYLTDRIAALEGKPQRYGTQFDWDENGRLSPNLYDDLASVNNRRQAIGLNSLDEQTALIRKQAARENQSPPADAAKRRQEADEWRRSVGWLA